MSLVDGLADLFTREALESISWKAADLFRVGDYFYDRDWPPQIFLLILLIILGVGIALLVPWPDVPYCGDGICGEGEGFRSCPQDCEETGSSIRIDMSAANPNGTYVAEVYDKNGNVIARQGRQGNQDFYFRGIDADSTKARVANTSEENWRWWESDEIDMTPEILPLPVAPNETETEPDKPTTPAEPGQGPTNDIVIRYPDDFNQGANPFVDIDLDSCLGEYLDQEPNVEEAYLAYMEDLLKNISLTGKAPPDMDESCADINNDGYLSIEDRMCLTGISDGTWDYVWQCLDCGMWPGIEVCNDGWDNNCDGQNDSEVYDNDAELPYTIGGQVVDVCNCNSVTPCEMMRSISGFPGNYDEDSIQRCVSINGSDFTWLNDSEWACNFTKAGETLDCANEKFTCGFDMGWFWNDTSCLRFPDFRYACYICDDDGNCDMDESLESCPNDCPEYIDFDVEEKTWKGEPLWSPHIPSKLNVTLEEVGGCTLDETVVTLKLYLYHENGEDEFMLRETMRANEIQTFLIDLSDFADEWITTEIDFVSSNFDSCLTIKISKDGLV